MLHKPIVSEELPSRLSSKSSVFYIDNLHHSNYRQLQWNIPITHVKIQLELGFPSKFDQYKKHCTEYFDKRTYQVQVENHFRNINSKHFCHDKEYLLVYDISAAKRRDKRREKLFGHTYYCFNHPTHYKQAKLLLAKETEKYADYLTDKRELKSDKYDRRSKIGDDGHYKMNHISQRTRYLTYNSDEYDDLLTHKVLHIEVPKITPPQFPIKTFVDAENKTPISLTTQSVKSLYNQAVNIMNNIIQTPVDRRDQYSRKQILPYVYPPNKLVYFGRITDHDTAKGFSVSSDDDTTLSTSLQYTS
ncbi:unnamed protein product [Trichobilharzia szidati]|nr:unnamed protein product [Trichobilharzia szidati]